MCTGLEYALIASLAGTVAGTGMQMYQQDRARDKAADLQAMYDEKNSRLTKEAMGIQEDAMKAFNRDQLDKDAAQQKEEISTKMIDDFVTPFDGDTTVATPQIIKDESRRASGKARDEAARFADGLAGLRGLDQSLFMGNIGLNRSGQDINALNSMISGNNRTLGGQLGMIDASSPMGDMLVGLGQAGLSAAGSGMFSGAGAAAAGGAPTMAAKTGKTMGGSILGNAPMMIM